MATTLIASSTPYFHHYDTASEAHHSMSTPATEPSLTGNNNSSSIGDDELLDLLASDSFSLESSRDRDLMAISNLLQGSLQTGTSPPPPGDLAASSSSQWIKTNNNTFYNNGWRSDASTSTQNYPAFNDAPTPSSSLSNHDSSSTNGFRQALEQSSSHPPPPTPSATPLSSYHALPSPDTSRRNFSGFGSSGTARGGVGGSSSEVLPSGCRAPAVSRERAPVGINASDWSTRLRSASSAGGYAIRPPSYQEAMESNSAQRRAHASDGDGHAMSQMMDENDGAMSID